MRIPGKRGWRVVVAVVALFGLYAVPGSAADAGLSPADAQRSFVTEPGLVVDLVAAEPLVVAPCATVWDESGRLWVVENRGYPTGAPDGRPAGRIVRLEDTDGDGRMDRRVELATGLTFPNGLMPWRGGWVVTCAPEVLWLADTNGDGRADVREAWLTGFDDRNTTQLRVSHPLLGPDGWIHFTSGWTGESVVRPARHPDRAVRVRTDSRYQPDTGDFAATDGRAQFGHTFDDLGRRFTCFNRIHVQHVVLPSASLRSNPHLNFAGTIADCPENMVNDLLGGRNVAARIYPVSENITTADSHHGTFSAACGIHVYRGDALPAYRGRVFTCDPTGNLVHWDELVPSGATFVARRSPEHREFLASKDDWFRPVNLATGPDGALYVSDMHRGTIEHPQYLPEAVRARTDFNAGRDHGRIWRIRATNAVKGARPVGRSATEELAALADANGWRRDTAFRLLIEQPDAALVPGLARLVGTASDHEQVAALRLLAAWGRLDDATVRRALTGPRAIREVACELLEGDPARVASMAPLLVAEINRPSTGRSLLWALLAVRQLDFGVKRDVLLDLVRRGGVEDRWQRAALGVAVTGQAAAFLGELMESPSGRLPERGRTDPELIQMLARLAALEADPASLEPLLRASLQRAPLAVGPGTTRMIPVLDLVVLAGVDEGWRERPAPRPRLATWIAGDPAMVPLLPPLRDLCRRVMIQTPQPLGVREAAAALLGSVGGPGDVDALMGVLGAGHERELQSIAVRGCWELGGTNAAARLLSRSIWWHHAPAAREMILAGLIGRRDLVPGLLNALERGDLPVNALSAANRRALTGHGDAAVRERAGRLMGAAADAGRERELAAAREALRLPGKAGNGRLVFSRLCAGCHRLDREGIAVGPDLFGMRSQPKETILLHVVDPDREVAPAFAAYNLETRDGRALSGLLIVDTPAVVTVRQAQGIEETFRRRDLVRCEPATTSLMPPGLLQGLAPQESADLLAFLKGE